jgi:hypothetical protein
MQIQIDNREALSQVKRKQGYYQHNHRYTVADYVQWRRSWQERGRDSEESEEVQLIQLKMTFPEKNSNQMGLSEVKSVKGFWNVFDKNITAH